MKYLASRKKSGSCLSLGKPKNEREFDWPSKRTGKKLTCALHLTLIALRKTLIHHSCPKRLSITQSSADKAHCYLLLRLLPNRNDMVNVIYDSF